MGAVVIFAASPSDDAALARACAAGERDAQTRLFRQHVQAVHGLIYRVLGPRMVTEDLVQETFLRVFRSLPTFRGEAQLATWIGRIAMRVAIEHLRRARPPQASLESVPHVSSDDPAADDQLAAREGLRRLYQILERLDAKYRIAFTLHVIDGRPQEEVASLMSASGVATRTRIWRARREVERRARQDGLLAAYVGLTGEAVR